MKQTTIQADDNLFGSVRVKNKDKKGGILRYCAIILFHLLSDKETVCSIQLLWNIVYLMSLEHNFKLREIQTLKMVNLKLKTYKKKKVKIC